MLKRFFVFLAIALAVILVLCWIYLPAVSRYHELKQEEDRLGKKIREIDGQIKTLADEKYLLQNDLVYLEKVIREELGFVKPGEIIYEMVTKKNAGASAAPLVTPTGSTADRVLSGTPSLTAPEVKKTEIKPADIPVKPRKIRSPANKTLSAKRRSSQT